MVNDTDILPFVFRRKKRQQMQPTGEQAAPTTLPQPAGAPLGSTPDTATDIGPVPDSARLPLVRPRLASPPPQWYDPRMLNAFIGNNPNVAAETVPAINRRDGALTAGDRAAAGRAPLMRDSKGRTVSKPRYENTGDRSRDLENYAADLDDYRDPKDTNGWWGRLKAALMGGMGGLAGTGDPLGGAGGALFGFLRNLISPNSDERDWRDGERRRVAGEQGREHERRMRGLQTREAAARVRDLEDKPERERELAQMRSRPKPFVLGGKRINYRPNEQTGEWEPYEETAGGQPLVDASKVPNAEGLLPGQVNSNKQKELDRKARERAAAANRQFRREENEADRKQRQEQFAGRMKLGWANYQQRIAEAKERLRHNLETERQQAADESGRGVRAAISYRVAKERAHADGVDLPDYIDLLTDLGVEVRNDRR